MDIKYIRIDPRGYADNFRAEAEVTPAAGAEAGLAFLASGSEGGSFKGYFFAACEKYVSLYFIGGKGLEILGKRRVAGAAPYRLRVELNGGLCRAYIGFAGEEEQPERWPVFELELEIKAGKTGGMRVGAAVSGGAAEIHGFSVSDYTAERYSDPSYKNPVLDDYADPGVIYYKGLYYLYATGGGSVGYRVHTSPDLTHWTDAGVCQNSAWDMPRWYWAPEVVARNGRFYMIMSVNEHLGVSVASSPLGPFVPERNWLFERSIDGHYFIDGDGDGKVYLFYVSWREGHEYGIYALRMEDDMVTPILGTETRVLYPTEEWEKHDGAVTEGPFVIKHNGLYYLTYSGSGFTAKEYAIGYAVASSPSGPYIKYEANPILNMTRDLCGTGHHSITSSPDGKKMYIVYHVHRSNTSVQTRRICVDRIRFVPTPSGIDRLEVYGPTGC